MNRPRIAMAKAVELAACYGKHAFATRRVAMDVVNRRRNKKEDRQRAEPYRCPYCRSWHIGTSIKR